ncbi:uncharacterized protein LOC127254971 isoform X2 [Andrographis paniculata]|uniref:uncharacterized protein LOC127254971 isoform X2 n=1 Tax=Andrographis paniculata TaxID=175694 RepID=UPI0021E8E528|nr:uncharacterized protein LOC127254971 isoform X2 [Andrographis paniculata]
MLLSQSRSVAKRKEDRKFRNKFKGKKKHKRLDAICEKAYNRSHGAVENGEAGSRGVQLELRRSNRARKAPVLLDSSPLPPKKRQKIDGSVPSSVQKVGGDDKRQCKTSLSSFSDLVEQNGDGVWGRRLRSRGNNDTYSGRGGRESSFKGKRKLYKDLDEYGNDLDTQFYDKKGGLAGEKSTVVKSKRPGRIKASNILANGAPKRDLADKMEDDKDWCRNEVEDDNEMSGDEVEDDNEMSGDEVEDDNEMSGDEVEDDSEVSGDEVEDDNEKSGSEVEDDRERSGNEVEDDTEGCGNGMLDVTDEMDGLNLEITLECRREIESGDDQVTLQLGEREETAIQRKSEIENCPSNDNDKKESKIEHIVPKKSARDIVSDEVNTAETKCAIDDEQKDEDPHKPLEEEIPEKCEEKTNAIVVAGRKPRIKLGRCCGLCGGGTDGKPPKILALEGTGSDNEAFSGSSASEEPNYDVWDGFGDQSGWLGRLLGPINDRYGIAGIWVHQQCAVWSPEVYFAGLGCLKNVRAALYRGRVLKCSRCRRPGATIGCRVDRCPKTYHLPCARAKGCLFDHRKFLIVCTDHRHLFQPYGIQNAQRLKKMKAKKLKWEFRKMANDASRKDIEAEEKWLENCGEDEEFLKRESKRLHRDLWRIAPTYIGGANHENESQYHGWESVAGLQDVIQCMKEVVILPLLYPEFFNNLGITPPRGVLLHGHPGTGKTLVVRALVGSCAHGDRRIAYFARKGADCLGKYVGDAERQLRLLFQVAEKSQPSIIFFDEIDGLAPSRSKRQDQTHNSVVSTLLALMDGLKSRGSVIVIGATNRPDAVDPALRRPGRFDREIYFPLPSVKDREAILSLHTKKWPKPLIGSLLKWVAKQTVGYAGADLQALCTQAAMIALRRSFPLQEALLSAETGTSKSRSAIPTLVVEEKDWLKALSCAPPPCSRRESGVALNDVVSSPLKLHLVPCLLQPLTRLLVCLCLNESVWLPPHLSKVSTMVKDVTISYLDGQREQSNNWWLHIDGLLEEVDFMSEIEKNLMLANVLVGESSLCDFESTGHNGDEEFSGIAPSSSQSFARPELLKKMTSGLCNNSGFQVLICGNPRSGQRHLASCLLHFFVGNVDIWKVDLASISHEGHGDMVHGLTRILRCAQTNLCLLYMPAIDLWAFEMDDEAPEDCKPSSNNHNSSDVHYATDMKHAIPASDDKEALKVQTSMKKASYLWTLFVEQVESMRVNSLMMILATSELPFSLLPSSVRRFFGDEVVNCGLSSLRDRNVPQFSLQLDGKLDHNKVINCFAAKLSKDLAQQFVHSLHGGNHIHESPFAKNCETVEGEVDLVCNSQSVHVSSLNPAGLSNKSVKVKSSLTFAISAVGYQILSYPHFAELCWVTSKLKEGPCANVHGPWKGWPFNSCIVCPSYLSEQASDANDSGNIKQNESSLVRGLIAVGLSAYRGEYTSLKEVCLEVRKVLETLVKRIDEKVQAGKDKNQFIRILSQVSYLDDMVMSWAHTLQSLEVDSCISEANPTTYIGPVSNVVSKDSISDCNKLRHSNLDQTELWGKIPQGVETDGADGCPEADGEMSLDVKRLSNMENSALDFSAKDYGYSDPTDGDHGCQDECDAAEVKVQESTNLVVLDDSAAPKAETDGNQSEFGDGPSFKRSNGFTKRHFSLEADGSLNSSDKQGVEVSSSDEVPNQRYVQSLIGTCVDGCDPKGSCGTKSSNPTGRSVDICFYQCCSKCFSNLNNLLLRIVRREWGLGRSDYTVEDVHDFVASLSTKLHLLLHKLFQCGKRKSADEGTELHERKYSGKLVSEECSCHAMNERATSDEAGLSQTSQGCDSRFTFKDGVLSSTLGGRGTDVSYHCKFKKLCLDSLIEWLGASKEVS